MRPTSHFFRRSKRQRGPVRRDFMERFGLNCKIVCRVLDRSADLIPQQVVDCGLCAGLCIDAFNDDCTGKIWAGAAIGQRFAGY